MSENNVAIGLVNTVPVEIVAATANSVLMGSVMTRPPLRRFGKQEHATSFRVSPSINAWEAYSDSDSLFRIVQDFDSATMGFDDFFRNCKAKPGSFLFSRDKWSKDFMSFLDRDSAAAIRYIDQHPFALKVRGDGYDFAGGRSLNRVHYQIHYDLLHSHRIEGDQGNIRKVRLDAEFAPAGRILYHYQALNDHSI